MQNSFSQNVINFFSKWTNNNKVKRDKNSTATSSDNIENKYSKEEVIGVAAATAITAAAIAGIVIKHKQVEFQNIEKTNNSFLKSENSELNKIIYNLTDKVIANEEEISALKQDKEKIQTLLDDFRNKMNDLLCLPGEDAPSFEKIENQINEKINSSKLEYDPMTPPTSGKSAKKISDNAVELPKLFKKGEQEIPLIIPEVRKGKKFEYTVPAGKELTFEKAKNTQEIIPEELHSVGIVEGYADAVVWDNDKIARDILQNFYDSHGHTLDGVKIIATPLEKGRYKIRIEGGATYTPDKATYIGKSTKRSDAKAAGNYGEGLKIATLKLLKDSGAQNVKIGSDNWKVTYQFVQPPNLDERALGYSLEKTDKINGNYFEFETGDFNLVKSFRKSINRFYHSHNIHFKNLDFENELVGIKLLPEGEKGGIYISGQRFEFENDYDGLKNCCILIKQKPPEDVINPSRDRTSLTGDDIKKLAEWAIPRKSYSFYESDAVEKNREIDKQFYELIQALKPNWNIKYVEKNKTPVDIFLESLLYRHKYENYEIKFPENYVAYSFTSDDVINNLEKNGYIVCKEDFADYGMQTIKELMGKASSHKPVKPTKAEKKKILILKEAILKLKSALQDMFNDKELDTKIYLFDNKGVNEIMAKDTQGEAIVNNELSEGFWLDRAFINRASFGEALGTSIHELCHKAGGDDTAAFTYEMSDAFDKVLDNIIADPITKAELLSLFNLWNKVAN